MVTGEASTNYNSVAWSVGITDQWLWPGSNIVDFDRFYGQFGYSRSPFGSIALWGHNFQTLTHVSIQMEGVDSVWESKCGADLRIRHERRELAGQTMGKILTYYNLMPGLKKALPVKTNVVHNKLSKEERAFLSSEIATIPKKRVLDFNKAFEDWQNSWFVGRHAVCSNSDLRTHCVEFFKLQKMGSSLLPLLILKLDGHECVFGNLLLRHYFEEENEALNIFQNNAKVAIEGEQAKTARYLKQYFDRKLCSA